MISNDHKTEISGSEPYPTSKGKDDLELPHIPPIKAFAKNVWILDGPNVRDMGVWFTTRMTIVKLSDSTLWIESPVPVPFDTLKCITELGPVQYLIAATSEARLAAEWVAHAISRSTVMDVTNHPIYIEEWGSAIYWYSGGKVV